MPTLKSVASNNFSFRDPSGTIFYEDGLFKRAVTHYGKENFDHLTQSGLYEKLVGQDYLVSHREEAVGDQGAYKILLPRQIPFISYPYEWSFSAFQDAALLTLDIQLQALEYGMSLKDATPFNIQFVDGKPIFIDTLSFEKFSEKPWVAYKQFCEMFLAPLAMMSFRKADFNKYLSVDINGIDLSFCSQSLPRLTRLNPFLLAHIHLHASSQIKHRGSRKKNASESSLTFSKNQMKGLVQSLIMAVKGLKLKKSKTIFGDYYAEAAHYSKTADEFKLSKVRERLSAARPATVLDLGANNGRYSRLAVEAGAFCLSMDNDAYCVDQNYREVKQKSEKKIMPLFLDLSNPFSGAGWAGKERMSFFERAKPDSVLALALVHHLRITVNVPLVLISSFFSQIAPALLIEFVPKGDPMVNELLKNRADTFLDYDAPTFEAEFSRHFEICGKFPIPDTSRILYEMVRKDR